MKLTVFQFSVISLTASVRYTVTHWLFISAKLRVSTEDWRTKVLWEYLCEWREDLRRSRHEEDSLNFCVLFENITVML